MNAHEGDNIGGVAKIEIIHAWVPTGFNPVVLPAESDWENIPFKEETANLKIDGSDSENGQLFGYSGGFLLPRMRPEIENAVNKYLGKTSILRITDMNDEIYIIGSPHHPVELKLSGSTGSNYPNENWAGYSYQIEQPMPHFKQ